jgi:hypothetical protein
MSLLDAYAGLMESMTWRARTSIDQYGDPSYTDSTISAIWFTDEKMIRTAEKEELQQLAVIMTKSAVSKGDAITRGGITYPVIAIGAPKNFEGEQFRTVRLG